jgi:hypothetical protein
MIAKHNMLPWNQFAFAGRSTTMAIQSILNPIYTALCNRRTATLLSLDVTGAYDYVRADKLLSLLAENGVPDWLILFVQSYMTNRKATLAIPGYQTDPFYVNIGIPQGSALSSVLFMLFAAPLLKRLNAEVGYPAVGFADDHYLIAESPTPEQSCALITKAYDLIKAVADEYNIKFAPEKYRVMHFLGPNTKNPSRRGDSAWQEPETSVPTSTDEGTAPMATIPLATTTPATTTPAISKRKWAKLPAKKKRNPIPRPDPEARSRGESE